MSKDKMIRKIAGKGMMLAGGFIAATLGETLGETVGYGLKMKLFPEFREAELASAQQSIEQANYIRDENERRKKKKKKKEKKEGGAA